MMTEKAKQYVEKWLFVWIVGFIIACLLGLQMLKADNSAVNKIEAKADKNCDKIDETKELLHSLDKKQAEILTILKSWEIQK